MLIKYFKETYLTAVLYLIQNNVISHSIHMQFECQSPVNVVRLVLI